MEEYKSGDIILFKKEGLLNTIIGGLTNSK